MLANSPYQLNLSNPQLEKKVVGITFNQDLNQIGELKVLLAQNCAVSQLPQQASLTLNSREVFSGTVLRFSFPNSHQCLLTYVDPLFLLSKQNQNQFIKQQSLRDCLDELLRSQGLQAEFKGDFSERLAGFQQGESGSKLQLITHLSNKYGFYFSYRADQKKVYFAKVGQSFQAIQLNKKDCLQVQHFNSSAEYMTQRVQYRYFDSKNNESSQQQVNAHQLYQSISNFTGHSSYRDKLSWKTAQGSVDTHITDRHHFEGALPMIGHQLSKQILNQEQVALKSYRMGLLPGDKLQLSEPLMNTSFEGAYLTTAVHYQINNARPQLILKGTRA